MTGIRFKQTLGARCALAMGLGPAFLACAPAAPQIEPRVGDSLLQLIRQEHIESYPETNLPDELAAALPGPFLIRSLEFPASGWIPAGNTPEHLRAYLGVDSGVQYWRIQPNLAQQDPSAMPRIVVAGEAHATWEPEAGPFPGLSIWYEESSQSLFALCAEQPEGVALDYLTFAAHEFERFEKLLGAGSGTSVPELDTLIGRIEMKGGTTRPCLLLPAGGAIHVPFASFPATGIRLAVGLADHGYRIDFDTTPPRLSQAPQQSDGARFVLEVVEQETAREVWSHELRRVQTGWRHFEFTVDLSEYQGKPITVRLRTEPGTAGDASFDYGLWSDLRLIGEPRVKDKRPHIVLLDIDTLRPDRLSCYGHPEPTTPRIDAWFGRRGVRFEDALATASWTLPSTASMLTGLSPNQHQMLDHDAGLSSEVDTLATLLRRSGYETYSVAEGPFFNPGLGLDRGFDRHRIHGRSDVEGIAKLWMRQLDHLRSSVTGRPAFLFLQTYLVHAPYELDERFVDLESYADGRFRGESVRYDNVIDPFLRGDLELSAADRDYINALYDAGVARMDNLVGDFLDELDAVLGDRQALVILTSDHGEEFWEHGQMGHGHSLYNELLRVPMLVRFPGDGADAFGAVSPKPVSLLDIAPTVLDVAGLAQPRELPGLSLRGELPDQRARVGMLWSQFQSIEFDSEKLILGEKDAPLWTQGPLEFYALGDDAAETRNRADEYAANVERLAHGLENYNEAHPAIAPGGGARSSFSVDEARRLRELGYLGTE